MNSSEPTYQLSKNGDFLEQHYWNLFIKDQFPSYEKFWLKFVIPLTNRPFGISFKTDIELKNINKSEADLCIAQLNYSIFRHLARGFEVLKKLEKPNSNRMDEQIDLVQEGMYRLVGAQDNAFELLERLKNPNKYQPFLEKIGEKARKEWQISQKFPLQNIRSYRNYLMHGHLSPSVIDGQRVCLPEIGKENLYLDWRLVTGLSEKRNEYMKDFISTLRILEYTWDETIGYLENNWKNLYIYPIY